MMSFTSPMSRSVSRWMFPAKWGMSSGFTRPFCRISAVPRMEVRGVFSSWVTLATNSLRMDSSLRIRVTSATTASAPPPPSLMGAAYTCKIRSGGPASSRVSRTASLFSAA